MEARNRRPAPAKDEPAEPIKKVATETSSGFSVLDMLRVAGGILLFSSALSYLTTSGTSLTWGYNPWWTRAREWKNILVRAAMQSKYLLILTPAELPRLPHRRRAQGLRRHRPLQALSLIHI